MPAEHDLQAERRTGTRELVGNLLKERQQLLVRFCQLAGLEPYTPDKPVATRLQEFCQILVDYLAAVHFELYTRLSDGRERRQAVLKVAERHYPRLTVTTEHAVDFNDKYENINWSTVLETLPDDLSELGEVLAERFELEDKLFTALHAAV